MPLALLQETYIVDFESEAVAEALSIISSAFSIDVELEMLVAMPFVAP